MDVWSKTLQDLKMHLNEQVYSSWFEPIECDSFTQGHLVLRVPNAIFEKSITKHYLGLLKDILSSITGKPPYELSISFVSGSQQKTGNEKTNNQKKIVPMLNKKYTFENFVVGPSNQFAHAASIAVANSPAKAYNPLFIYGGVGLGKTHLMQAIGWFITNSSEHNFRAAYVSSEDFTNQLIHAIQNRKTSSFRTKYRNIDILLIDDIQFLAGKESTQEEFFHTFNTLHNAHKQIVISSDRPPKEIPTLEERLVSRFDWGLVTDIQPPDLETRRAIIGKKCLTDGTEVPEEVMLFIATKIKFNIRELEGALNKVVAFCSINKKSPTLETAKTALADIIPKEKQISVDFVQRQVADYFDLHIMDMKKKNRSRNKVLPRQIAMFLARKLTDNSLPEIGDNFGGRDHTTVLHGCRKIEKGLQTKDEILKGYVDDLIQLIKG